MAGKKRKTTRSTGNGVLELRAKAEEARRRREETSKRAKEAKQRAKEARRLFKDARRIAKRAKDELDVVSKKLKKLLKEAHDSAAVAKGARRSSIRNMMTH
jgi:methyl-accepting chemotaxis protein